MGDELIDPAPLRDSIKGKIDKLFDNNQVVVGVLRTQAHDFEVLASFFEHQRQLCFDIASDIVALAAVAASNSANIIIAEFGSEEDDDDDEEDEPDDE